MDLNKIKEEEKKREIKIGKKGVSFFTESRNMKTLHK